MAKRNRARERARVAGGDCAPRPPAAVTRIHTVLEAAGLAQWLLQPGRPWPVVVVSTSAEATSSYVDVDRLKSDVGDLAEVAVVSTGDVSWAFSSAMPPMTQVYGGASRVYGVDNDWVDDPMRSPLRFAYSPADDERVRAKLVHDALTSAVRTGVVAAGPAPGAVTTTGVVRGVVGSRAFVSLDDGGDALVWEELTAPDIPLDRILTAGMRVEGEVDPKTHRLDLRRLLERRAPTTLAEMGKPGDLVLTQVTAVSLQNVSLRPVPGLEIAVPRELITGNPLDALTELFTVGEVVVARICPGATMLRLDDIGDTDDPTSGAPSLLPGGPPWLSLAPMQTAAARAPVHVPPPDELSDVVPANSPGTASERDDQVPTTGLRHPTPKDLATRGPGTPALPAPPKPPTGDTPVSQPRRGALQEVNLLLIAERTQVATLSRELTELRAKNRSQAVELTELRRRAAELESQLAMATHQIEEHKTRYRRADLARQLALKEIKSLRSVEGTKATDPCSEQTFLDPAEQFMHEVYLEWTRRIPATEKPVKPLPEYTLGEDFLASLESIEGVSRLKVLQVVVEVLTGSARRISGREVHRLRRGAGGDDPCVTRLKDDAQAWRAALQRNTPGARRLHYWQLPSGAFELSRVVLHDNMDP